MFEITEGKGVRITFANGWAVSVQWGPMNYCDNRRRVGHEPCANAEVAVFDPVGGFSRGYPGAPGNDDVRGWVTPDELVEIIVWAQSRPARCWSSCGEADQEGTDDR